MHVRPSRPLPSRSLRSELGQGSPEYLGVIIAGALTVLALVLIAPSLGVKVAGGIECAITRVLGGECNPDPSDEPCPISNSTSSDKVSAGLSIKAVSAGGSVERVIIKESFDDGSAIYTVVDRAELEVALGSRGGGARFLGSQGSLTAALAANGGLESAEIYETENQEQTDAIDEKLSDPGFAENIVRSGGEIQDAILDAPADVGCTIVGVFADCPDARPSDILPNPNEALADLVFGDQDLPEPDSEYVGGDVGITGLAEAISDNGGLENNPSTGNPIDEAGGEAELRVAGGGRVFTDGDREGETELYYTIDGSAAAGFEDAFLGTLGGTAEGEVTATVVIGADGQPKTLRLNATGTVTGEEDLGQGELSPGPDLEEALADSESGEGKTYEIVTELDISDPDNLIRAGQLLSNNPALALDGADGLIDAFRDDAEVRFATYDTEQESSSSGIDIVVANVGGESEDQTNTLESLYIKQPGSTSFMQTPCGTEGAAE